VVSLCPPHLRNCIATTLEITEQKKSRIFTCTQHLVLRTNEVFSHLIPAFVDSQANHVLLQTTPDVRKTPLQFIDIVRTTFVHTFLHDSPDLVVDRIQVWTLMTDEVGCLTQPQLDGVTGAKCFVEMQTR